MIVKDKDGLIKQGILSVKKEKYFGCVPFASNCTFSIPFTAMMYFKTHKGVKLDFDYFLGGTNSSSGTLLNCGYSSRTGGWGEVQFAFQLWVNGTNVEAYVKLSNSGIPVRLNPTIMNGIVLGQINKFSLIGPTETDINYYISVNDKLQKLEYPDKIKQFWDSYGEDNFCEEWTFGERNMLNSSYLYYGQLSLACISIFDKTTNAYTAKHLYAFDAVTGDDTYVPDRVGGCNGTITNGIKITNAQYRQLPDYVSKEQRVLARVEEKIQNFNYFINAEQGDVGTDNWWIRRTGGSSWGSYAASSKPLTCGEISFTYNKYIGINAIGLNDVLIPTDTYSLMMYGFYIYDESKILRMIYNHGDSVDVGVPTLGDTYTLKWEIGQPVKFYVNGLVRHTFPGLCEQPLYPATAMYSWVPTDYKFNFKIIQKTLTVQGIRRPTTRAYSFLEYNQCYNNISGNKIRNVTGINAPGTDMFTNSGVKLNDWMIFDGSGYGRISPDTSNYIACVNTGKFFTSLKFKIANKSPFADWSVLVNASIEYTPIFNLGVNITTGRLIFQSFGIDHIVPEIIKIEQNKEYCVCVCVNKTHARIIITDGKTIGFHEITNFQIYNNSWISAICIGMARGGKNYLEGSIKNFKFGNMLLSNDEMTAIVEEEINY